MGSFWKCFERLPPDLQGQAKDAYRQFKNDPHQRGLRFKKVHASRPIYSVRVTRGYRALGILENETVTWFWIGSHAEYERMLSKH